MGPACRISFSTDRVQEPIDWRQSGRLTPGALVVLSPREDKFRTQCLVATVAGREIVGGLEPNLLAGEAPDTPPRVDVFWPSTEHAILDPNVDMIMIETKSGYFESLRHTMTGLQQAMWHE